MLVLLQLKLVFKGKILGKKSTVFLRPQFVDTLFIVKLRPNTSMRRAVIINYLLFIRGRKSNIIVNLHFALSPTKYPLHNPESKEHRLNQLN